MSHEVESMFYTNDTPWHGLGTYVDHAPTAEEAITAAGLGWDVVMKPLMVEHNGEWNTIGDESAAHLAVQRQSDGRVFAVLGKQYTPLQNRDAFRPFDRFVEAGLLQYETAGSLKGGRRVWVLASMTDGTKEVVKGDPVKAHFLLSNTHDGTSPVMCMMTSVRVVCWNTMQMAFQDAGAGKMSARHTRNLMSKVDKMEEFIAGAHSTFQAELDRYKFLATAQLDSKALELYVKAIFGKDKEDEHLPKGGAQIIELFESGKGNQLPKVRGTMWAALNAVTEYVDHHRGAEDDKRLESAWFGQGVELKQKALEVASQGAMALRAA